MNKIIIFFIILLFCYSFSVCENSDNDRYFVKTFGFQKNDLAYSIALDKNGESREGELLWSNTYGKSGSAIGYQSKTIQDDDIITVGIYRPLNKWYNDILYIRMNHHGMTD